MKLSVARFSLSLAAVHTEHYLIQQAELEKDCRWRWKDGEKERGMPSMCCYLEKGIGGERGPGKKRGRVKRKNR